MHNNARAHLYIAVNIEHHQYVALRGLWPGCALTARLAQKSSGLISCIRRMRECLTASSTRERHHYLSCTQPFSNPLEACVIWANSCMQSSRNIPESNWYPRIYNAQHFPGSDHQGASPDRMVSEYERKRAENIRQRQIMEKELGLQPFSSITNLRKKTKKRSEKLTASAPTRKSQRLRRYSKRPRARSKVVLVA